MLQSTDATPAGKTGPIEQEGHEDIDHEIRSARHLAEGLQDAPQCVPRGGDRINAEREHSRQGVPALDRPKLTPWRQ